MFSERIEDYIVKLGLDENYLNRPSMVSRAVASIFGSLDSKRNKRRSYLLGVYCSFTILAEWLCKQQNTDHIDNVFNFFPPVTTLSTGSANTLILGDPGLSLRNAYNNVEVVIRHDLQRPDYPNCAPHATQSWSQYSAEFETVCAMSPEERTTLTKMLWNRILDIPYIEAQDGAEREIRPFEHIVLNFPTAKHEPSGVVLQALAYAYYRADSPSVTFRVYKVGSGSSRVGAAGDVDGWTGKALSLSVEVKDKPVNENNLNELDQFLKNLERWPNATGIVLASEFSEEAIDYLKMHNVLAFDRQQMALNVSYWDVPKQKLAVQELYPDFRSRFQKKSNLSC